MAVNRVARALTTQLIQPLLVLRNVSGRCFCRDQQRYVLSPAICERLCQLSRTCSSFEKRLPRKGEGIRLSVPRTQMRHLNRVGAARQRIIACVLSIRTG
ncbi:hypothetical protein KCP76_20775 [Salmonella enterica subsp. enterica serovar Weltevreden]|nr:hypothetical protein KCP76_20775 [Salmonella enterica subsp. enterica serovar Weltevreden]